MIAPQASKPPYKVTDKVRRRWAVEGTFAIDALAFWSKVSPADNGCWLWTGQKANQLGYGAVAFHNDRVIAHRHACALVNGPIPEGHSVLHSCDNPACVNPAHLRAGTHAENMRDKVAHGRQVNGPMLKTHCLRGHPLSGDNLRWDKPTKGWGNRPRRVCLECRRIRKRQARARSVEARSA